MNEVKNSNWGTTTRRSFFKNVSTAGLALGTLGVAGCASSAKNMNISGSKPFVKPANRPVSFVAGKDQREASYNALKPLEKDIINDIGDKQIVIKINSGQTAPNVWLNATDANFVRGILDFLKPIHDKQVIIAEATAAGPPKEATESTVLGTMVGFENYGYMPLVKEYNVRLYDLNDDLTTLRWITMGGHPQGINLLNTFLDPNVYMISATRFKTHNNVIVTLSHKNIAMASPINRYRQALSAGRNDKRLMHGAGNRDLHFNLFQVALFGVQPDLAVLDGIVGMEGNGPVNGTPISCGDGCVVASTDWVAADRLGTELMGVDYKDVKYLQWCSEAGMGEDDLSAIKIIGPDYRKYITKFTMNPNIDSQLQWIREDYKE